MQPPGHRRPDCPTNLTMGLALAFLTALLATGKSLVAKKALGKLHVQVVSLGSALAGFLLLPGALLVLGWPEISLKIGGVFAASALLNVLALLAYNKALQLTDVSLLVPLLTLSPIPLLFTALVVLGEFPPPMGLGGVVLLAVGAYLLHFHRRQEGLLAPFKALWEDPGLRWGLLVLGLWSLTSAIDGYGVRQTNGVFWAGAIRIGMSLMLVPLVLRSHQDGQEGISWEVIRQHRWELGGLLLIAAGSAAAQFLAYGLTYVSYVIAVKRLSAVLSVLAGAYFFQEKGLRERLLGASVMVAGVILLSLSGG